MDAIQNLRRQPENSVFKMDVQLRHPKPVPHGHYATANGVQEKQRAVHDDMVDIESLLQGFTFHDAREQVAFRETAWDDHETYETSASDGYSSPQNYGPRPSEPPRFFIPKRILKQKQHLPIFIMKEDFVKEIRKNQVLIVVGETGSGKSTQLTQYLYENGFGTRGKICCTQPRRVAAKALAKRVAKEVGSELGDRDRVGYHIRFDNNTTNNTSIIYMTDGMLLQELVREPLICSYACIMLDEAHERSMNTDVLLGLLKVTIRKRPDLKLLITSATIDAKRFSEYFNDAPVFEIPGRTFPVTIEYMGCSEKDYVNACANTVINIHRFETEGDILVFLGGEGEIERCRDLILMREKRELWVLPCCSSLPLEEQNKVFEPTPEGYLRKVVVATNIAETSITIDGIVYVVDSGIVKQSEYDPQKKLTTLNTMRITQAQAIQRAGRAGRTRPGKCFRLYCEHTFKCTMPKAPVPEILRSNLESTVLKLAASGVKDVSRFDFMDPPSPQTIEAAVTELKHLEALKNGRLTPMGGQMSRFPLEPKLSKALIMSVYLECTDDILTITSIFSVQNSGRLFWRPKGLEKLADSCAATFFRPEGDHNTYLNVFKQWEGQNYSIEWCRKNYVNFKFLEEVYAIRQQLEYVLELSNLKVTPSFSLPDPQAIQKCITSVYFSHIARKTVRGHGYVTYANLDEEEQVFIHPSSALFKSEPNWIIYEELKNTGNKAYLINAVAVEPRWIREYAPQFFEKLKHVFPELMDFLDKP